MLVSPSRPLVHILGVLDLVPAHSVVSGRLHLLSHDHRVLALVLAVMMTSLFTPPEAAWQWPVSSASLVVRDFSAPESPWGPGHRGLDLKARVGERVVAPEAGIIHYSGKVAGRYVLTIRTREGHLISLEPLEEEFHGSRVRAGDTLGTVADGHCPGGCLHIGLRVNGEYRSPARELGILRRAILAG